MPASALDGATLHRRRGRAGECQLCAELIDCEQNGANAPVDEPRLNGR
jgi:hypothetical protein